MSLYSSSIPSCFWQVCDLVGGIEAPPIGRKRNIKTPPSANRSKRDVTVCSKCCGTDNCNRELCMDKGKPLSFALAGIHNFFVFFFLRAVWALTCFTLVDCSHGLAFTWWGCCGLCLWHCTTELAHSFSFCSCVSFCLYGPFNCVSFHKFSRQLSAFSICSSGLNSALLVLLTAYFIYKYMYILHIHVFDINQPSLPTPGFFLKFCSCVCVCLYGPFNCISCHIFSRFSTFPLSLPPDPSLSPHPALSLSPFPFSPSLLSLSLTHSFSPLSLSPPPSLSLSLSPRAHLHLVGKLWCMSLT